jgi:mRNA-degrading endonuclease RelE of RelBE toxin-antitoxin system
MVRSAPFEFVFATSVRGELDSIDVKWHSAIRDAMNEQLRFQPHTPTRNRKRLREPIRDAEWELRCGPDNRFRVLYNVDPSSRKVYVVAVGEKRNNQLWIADEKVTS